MKHTILLVFLFISVSAFSQNNELMLSYQSLKKDDYGKGLSLTYYRAITPRQALGIRTNVNRKTPRILKAKLNSLSIDVVSRWTFIKGKKFRLMAESGISLLRTFQEIPKYEYRHEDGYWFCGVMTPEELYFMTTEDKWMKSNRLGIASAISFDVRVFKRLFLGASYHYNAYITRTNLSFYEKNTKQSNLNINLGYKF